MTRNILIVEDEHDLRATLEYNLQREGYRTSCAATGEQALARLNEEPVPDLVLLDIMLPDMSGIEICRHLRKNQNTGNVLVLMLTARGEEIDRVVGFEVGADDYVVKPFSVRELMLRIRAILRRLDAEPKNGEVAIGPLRVDKEAHRVWVHDIEIVLTALEFRLLATFLERRGRVQTREVLLRDVWGIDADVTTRTVDTHVKRLRHKIGEAGKFIETLRGVGYRMCSKEEPE